MGKQFIYLFYLFIYSTVWKEKEKVSREEQQHKFFKRKRKENCIKRRRGWGGRRGGGRWGLVKIQIGCMICFFFSKICRLLEMAVLIFKSHLHRTTMRKRMMVICLNMTWLPATMKKSQLRKRAVTLVPPAHPRALLAPALGPGPGKRVYRSRVTPGKMSVSAQSFFFF